MNSVMIKSGLNWKSCFTKAGISDYSIFLDEETQTLFGVLWRKKSHKMDQLPEDEIMQRWWKHMSDIMETNPDGSPKVQPLKQVFHLD